MSAVTQISGSWSAEVDLGRLAAELADAVADTLTEAVAEAVVERLHAAARQATAVPGPGGFPVGYRNHPDDGQHYDRTE